MTNPLTTEERWRTENYREFHERLRFNIDKIEDNIIKALAKQALNQSIEETRQESNVTALSERFILHLAQLEESDQFPSAAWIAQTKKYTLVVSKHFAKIDEEEKPNPNKPRSALYDLFIKDYSPPSEIINLDITQPHTMPYQGYLEVRLSRAILNFMEWVNKSGPNTEIFIGSYDQMLKFYEAIDYRIIGEMQTNSSIRFALVQNRFKQAQCKVVACNLVNETKLHHLLLQLRYSKVDMTCVRIRGDVPYQKSLCIQELHDNFSKHVPNDVDIAFMGTQMQILIEVAKRFYPDLMKKAKDNHEEDEYARALLGETKDKTKKPAIPADSPMRPPEKFTKKSPTFSIEAVIAAKEQTKIRHFRTQQDILGGIYSYSLIKLKIEDREWSIIAFKMPNGNLAYHATIELIRKGVRHFVMVGAGGSLNEEADLGSYQVIQTTMMRDGPQIHLDAIRPIELNSQKIPLYSGRRNETVCSPLDEITAWYEGALKNRIESVDCETYHIAKALKEASGIPMRILPGLFTSDVIVHRPLSEKVGKHAYTYLPALVQSCLDFIGMPSCTKASDNLTDLSETNLDQSFFLRAKILLNQKERTIDPLLKHYIRRINKAINQLNQIFIGINLDARWEAVQLWIDLRRYVVLDIFKYLTVSEMRSNGIEFNEKYCIFTYEKFMRRCQSVGSEISLVMIDDQNPKRREIIQRNIEQLAEFGIKIKCILIAEEYFKATPQNLSHLDPSSVAMISGSEKIMRRAYDFSDKQLSEEFCKFLNRKEKSKIVEERLKSPEYKTKFQRCLNRLAILNTHRESIAKDMEDLSDIDKDQVPYAINVLNRMADFIYKMNIDIQRQRAFALDQLGIILSNIVCTQKAQNGMHPFLRTNESYNILTMRHLKKTTLADRMILSQIVDSLGFPIDPQHPEFPNTFLELIERIASDNLNIVKKIEDRLQLEATHLIEE